MRAALLLCVIVVAAPAAVHAEPDRPWSLYGSIGFPSITSIALARRVGPVEVMLEAGTLAPFPILLTGAAHAEVDLHRWGRVSLYAGATAAALYFWFTGYEGGGDPFWNWGAGPKLGARFEHQHVVIALEGGALFGEWEGTCSSCSVVPEAALRAGWTF